MRVTLVAELALDQLDDLDDVIGPGADVLVVHGSEFIQDLFQLHLQGPLGIAQFCSDVVLGGLADF